MRIRINIFSLHLATVIHKNISNGKFAMDGKMLCALSHVEHQRLTLKHTRRALKDVDFIPFVARSNNTLCKWPLSHSLRYNEMALRLMHRGEMCVCVCAFV